MYLMIISIALVQRITKTAEAIEFKGELTRRLRKWWWTPQIKKINIGKLKEETKRENSCAKHVVYHALKERVTTKLTEDNKVLPNYSLLQICTLILFHIAWKSSCLFLTIGKISVTSIKQEIHGFTCKASDTTCTHNKLSLAMLKVFFWRHWIKSFKCLVLNIPRTKLKIYEKKRGISNKRFFVNAL